MPVCIYQTVSCLLIGPAGLLVSIVETIHSLSHCLLNIPGVNFLKNQFSQIPFASFLQTDQLPAAELYLYPGALDILT